MPEDVTSGAGGGAAFKDSLYRLELCFARRGGWEWKLRVSRVVFFKATTAWAGPNDDIVIPRDSNKTDWEVELAVVIGKRAKYVSEDDALNYVAGYGVHNDYSEREWQLEKGGQWVKGKSADTYAPFGPYLATSDEVFESE